MASEYLKKKYKDVKPDVKRELTPAEKRKNWWYYHRGHFVVAAVLLAIVGSIVWNALHQVRPDYQIAYVGEYALPDDTAAALEAGFAALGEDLNGDGSVIVRLSQYTSSSSAGAEAVMSSVTRLMADLTECESYFFLLEDPEQFQESYGTLRRLDGTMTEERVPVEETCLLWSQCPVLAGMELGEYSYPLMGGTASGDNGELVSGLYIARRGFWTEKTSRYPEGCDALWEKITEGAAS